MKRNNTSKKEITLDDLALMVAKGFDEMNEKMNSGFEEAKSNIRELKTDMKEVKADIRELKTDIKEVKANLNKKVDKIDYNTLTYRVEKLEKNFA